MHLYFSEALFPKCLSAMYSFLVFPGTGRPYCSIFTALELTITRMGFALPSSALDLSSWDSGDGLSSFLPSVGLQAAHKPISICSNTLVLLNKLSNTCP